MSGELTIGEQIDLAGKYALAMITPPAYRKKAADILIAISLGQSIGLAPVQSMYEINVINGKPSMSAALVEAQVRKAGHTLRVKVDDTPGKECAICTIIRRDDPEYPFVSKRDRAWAQRMGLLKNPNYIKQLPTMLKKRAITDCARDACSEALCGIDYCKEELGDFDNVEATVEGTEETVEPTKSVEPKQNVEIIEAEVVNEPQSQPPLPRLIETEQKNEIVKILQTAGMSTSELRTRFMHEHFLPTPTSVMTYADAEAILANPQTLMNQASEWLREQSTKRTQEASQQQVKEQ
ncbi:hypothetical protein [Gardnerella vaginalis]|uniref:hypothetical protein n=1 Tax=Gardnerella vaginalis TaxID=2702 RepID=UPI00200F062C|nr:hypothetical protein [Gardnerella vaginalis]UQA84516.1 hypothetical protein K9E40_05665 [Gardnerella vaginalis]